MSSPPALPSALRSSTGVDDLHEMLEGLCERAIRGARDGVAGAVKHERTIPGYLAGELAHEATLARPRLAAEKHDPGAFSARPWHQRPEALQLHGPPDERKRRRQAKGGWKVVHARRPRNELYSDLSIGPRRETDQGRSEVCQSS